MKHTTDSSSQEGNGATTVENRGFYTAQGYSVPGVNIALFRSLLHELSTNYHVNLQQVAESGSYSFSMVVRHALGLSAEGGIVSVIASQGLRGLIALNTARYLVHAGACCHVLLLDDPSPLPCTGQSIQALEALDIPLLAVKHSDQLTTRIKTCIEKSQHIILGMDDKSIPTYLDGMTPLNEAICPVHAVQLPPGVDADSGRETNNAIFASSTLSLGVPLNGLHNAREHTGRHYICDISLPTRVMDSQRTSHPLLSDQPVQILLFDEPKVHH